MASEGGQIRLAFKLKASKEYFYVAVFLNTSSKEVV